MTQVGQCPHCRAVNSYEVAQCLDCRQPLPWAGTVQKYSSQMETARNAVQQLQAQVQQLQQVPQVPRMPFNGTSAIGVPVPVSEVEGWTSNNRFRQFIEAFIGEKASEFFEEMDDDRARIAAFLMAGFWDLCMLLGTWLILRNVAALIGSFFPLMPAAATKATSPDLSFKAIVKILAVSTFAWGVLVGLCSLTRVVGRGQGSFVGDLFVAGATLLPVGLFCVLAGAVGITNYDFVGILSIFAWCYVVFTAYRGLTTISKVPSAVAAVCVPLMFLLDGFALKVLVTRLMTP
ncbi:hypothetical protein IAD21_04671 [Abditibacteriota bacterium]|nr:hypothetical protein IAD21_04671 [Abditibacteriota bacterium]